MREADTVTAAWWQCPNNPPCPHGNLLHDIDSLEDPRPTCCVDGCNCGKRLTGVCMFCGHAWTVFHACEGQPGPVIPPGDDRAPMLRRASHWTSGRRCLNIRLTRGRTM